MGEMYEALQQLYYPGRELRIIYLRNGNISASWVGLDIIIPPVNIGLFEM